MEKKYPVIKSGQTNEKFKEAIKEVGRSAITSNYLKASDIVWQFRESAIYSDLIMIIINQIVKRVDCPSKYDLPGRSNYEDFEQTMTSIFQMVEDYDIMVKKDHRQEQVASKMICRMF